MGQVQSYIDCYVNNAALSLGHLRRRFGNARLKSLDSTRTIRLCSFFGAKFLPGLTYVTVYLEFVELSPPLMRGTFSSSSRDSRCRCILFILVIKTNLRCYCLSVPLILYGKLRLREITETACSTSGNWQMLAFTAGIFGHIRALQGCTIHSLNGWRILASR